jgi:hypothetical protein
MCKRWQLLLSDKVTSIFSPPKELSLLFHLKTEALNTDEPCFNQPQRWIFGELIWISNTYSAFSAGLGNMPEITVSFPQRTSHLERREQQSWNHYQLMIYKFRLRSLCISSSSFKIQGKACMHAHILTCAKIVSKIITGHFLIIWIRSFRNVYIAMEWTQ